MISEGMCAGKTVIVEMVTCNYVFVLLNNQNINSRLTVELELAMPSTKGTMASRYHRKDGVEQLRKENFKIELFGMVAFCLEMAIQW